MPVLDNAAPAEQGTDIDFVLQQLDALEPMAAGDDVVSCSGCNHCHAHAG